MSWRVRVRVRATVRVRARVAARVSRIEMLNRESDHDDAERHH